MYALNLAAITGLLSLATGVLLVNAVATPRAAQVGTVIAAFGVALLALVAVRQMFG
jgi:hypothetical protein